jgi:ATP-dependent DNA helicase PIF1
MPKTKPQDRQVQQKSQVQQLNQAKLKDDFKEVFELLENTNNHYFITGKAGTGKTTLLNFFRANTKKNIVVLAPTGIAAVSIGGSTIHSFFRFPPNLITKRSVKKVFGKKEVFSKIDCVVIDEISMVRADVMDGIDLSLRLNRGKKNIPFGGVQMIMFGDLYQLPPIIDDPELYRYFQQHYLGPYFFNAWIFEKEGSEGRMNLGDGVLLDKFEMETIFRQKDLSFIELLNNIRNGSVSNVDLALLNSRVCENLNEIFNESPEPIVVLTPINQRAFSINNQQLSKLPGKEFHYRSTSSGTFDERSYPADADLTLKVGAQIIMLQNDLEEHRWQNGTVGIVSNLNPNGIIVKIGGKDYTVERAIWKKTDYIYNDLRKEIQMLERGTFKQYPLKLAWAITIHKSQGKTFEKVIIDIGRGAFATGQTYVALSRCRTLKGIYLSSPILAKDVMTDRKVVDFMGGAG